MTQDRKGTGQLALFPGVDKAAPGVGLVDDPEAEALAARLSPSVRLGTSSWTFPGWAGILYAGQPSMAALVKGGLAAYARHPLLRTVSVDRSFYAPVAAEEWAAYARQVPPDFRAVIKMLDEVTTAVFPRHPRFGARAGERNPRFLDAGLARDVLAPIASHFAENAGPILLEFSPMGPGDRPDAAEFARRLDALLGALPTSFQFAVELRNRELLTPRYLAVLAKRGAAHVINFWSAMPRPSEQLAIPGILTAKVVVARLSLPPGTRYEDRARAFAPFDRLVDPQPALRESIAALGARCAEDGRELYVLVNNKVEGSSPLTVKALARALAGLPASSLPPPF